MRTSTRYITSLLAILALAAVTTASPAVAQEKASDQEKERVDRTVELAERNDSDVKGEIEIYEADRLPGQEMAKHRVDMKLRGLESGETYRVHLHGGTCEKGGQVVTPLARIEADDAGRGEATTKVEREQMSRKTDTRAAATAEPGTEKREHPSLFLQARQPDGTSVACGDLPMKEGEKDA